MWEHGLLIIWMKKPNIYSKVYKGPSFRSKAQAQVFCNCLFSFRKKLKLCVCLCHAYIIMCRWKSEQSLKESVLPSALSQGLNPGHQAWWSRPLLAKCNSAWLSRGWPGSLPVTDVELNVQDRQRTREKGKVIALSFWNERGLSFGVH